ncbi:MAG: GNAT family N-acetyltransferase [Patescibacteria group bacterium]|nr:GNAT family N-acetyltransferase [Patescibacteria group bacterium]MDE1945429.1 GNAT family N-acetyltransferase [Patescibacteria group bacterium]MDE2058005.1 GNAT family N-acetyltransferase [Patescibacteria group bacterium]
MTISGIRRARARYGPSGLLTEAYRGRRIASALFRRLGEVAKERGCTRLSFNVLKWNPAMDIYTKIGAVPLDDCVGMRIHGEALAALAE